MRLISKLFLVIGLIITATTAISQNYSTLYFYYTNQIGRRPDFIITFNGKYAFLLKMRNRVEYKITSTGILNIAYRDDNLIFNGELNVEIESGKNYYFRLDHGNLKLNQVDEATWKKEYSSLRVYPVIETSENITDPVIPKSIDRPKNSVVTSITPSDVDINIPINDKIKQNTYALIIGNEDYSTYQPGLSTEANVEYALNDANVFGEYCRKSLGIPEKQIKILPNATSGQIRQGLAWISNLAKIDKGKAELIFYYSGHGLPDEQTKEPYIIPVDINSANISLGIKLSEVYQNLNEYPTQKVLIFLDACFSGGARNQSLISVKGVRVKPKNNIITGNTVILSSSTGEESSGVYREKRHGYLTYFLLKSIKDSEKDIALKDLYYQVLENVVKESALAGKTQTPQIIVSSDIESVWGSWRIK